MKFIPLLCGLLPLCCGDLGAINFLLTQQNPGEDVIRIFYRKDGSSILFGQRAVQGLLRDSSKLKDYIQTDQSTEAALIHYWSLNNSQMYGEVLNDLARLGFDSNPDKSFMIECHYIPQFSEQCELVPFLNLHKFDKEKKTFLPEDVQGKMCVMKCYGPGVRFVDDYDGDSKSPGPRCRSLPWGLMKPLGLSKETRIPVPLALDEEKLPCIPLLQHFAVMSIYRADGTIKAVLSLYFASSEPTVSTEDALGYVLNTYRNLPQLLQQGDDFPSGECAVQ